MRLFSVNKSKSSTQSKHRTGKKVLIVTGMMLVLFMAAPAVNNSSLDSAIGVGTVYAAETTFSSYWYQDTDGTWKVRDGNGNIIKNAWLCDDAVASNGQNVWYLIDGNGNMVSAGLVQDQTGNYYSLETNHNGYYGMLRYKSGNYDGIDLNLESSHNGSFAAILNEEGINSLKSKYGVTTVNISNANCVYTSSFNKSSENNNQNTTTSTSTEDSNTGGKASVGGGLNGVGGTTIGEDAKYFIVG